MSYRLFLRIIGIAGVLILAASLRLWQVDSIPPGFHLDESYQGLEAWRILTEPGYHPFYLRGNFGPLPANAYLNVITFWLVTTFGGAPGPVAMRVTAAVVGILTVLSLFGLAVELRRAMGGGMTAARTTAARTIAPEHSGLSLPLGTFSSAFPFFAAITLAIMRWHIHYSRMGIESIYVPLIWTVAVWLLLRSWRTGSWLGFVASGSVVGLGMYTYRGAWVIPFLIVLLHLHLLLVARSQLNWTRVRQSILWGAVALIVILPLVWFYFNNPSLFSTRLEQVNIVGQTSSPADATIWGNLDKMARMFGPFGSVGDPDPRRNLPGAAALSWPLALFFYIGIGVSLWRVRHPVYALLLCGVAGMLALGVFSEYAPHFHRVLGAAAPVALLCAVGMDVVWRWTIPRISAISFRKMQAVAVRFAVIALLVTGGILEGTNYFSRWANMSSLYHAFDVGLWEIGQTLAAKSPDAVVYITPRELTHPTLAFAWEIEHANARADACDPLSFDGRHVFPMTDGSANESEFYAVIEHEDFRTPLLLPGVLPDYTIFQEILDYDGGVYGRIYERPAASRGARLPQNPLNVDIGDGIRLVGYDVQPADLRAGEILYLQLHWVVEEKPENDWTIFTHVRTNSSESPQQVAGHDSKPGNGSLPTRCWLAGQRILDEYQIPLPAELPADEYQLYIGLYQPNGERLPVDGVGVNLDIVQIIP